MRYLTFVFFLLLNEVCLSQTYMVKHLGAKEGLSNSYIVDIAQDKNGDLWFATEEGLNRLEGNHFVPFYKNETDLGKSITGNELNCLLDDPAEPKLWIGTQRAGLNAYNYQTHTFEIYLHDDNDPQSLATNDITNIQAASDGGLWISTYWRGVDYFDKKEGHFIHYNQQTVPGLISNNTWTALDDGNGNLYIGHVNDGLSILSLSTGTIRNFRHNPADKFSIPGNEIRCIFQDQNKTCWIGTNKGLAIFNPQDEKFIRLGEQEARLSHSIYDIKQINGSQIWIGVEFGGIAIIDASRPYDVSMPFHFDFIEDGEDEYSLSNSSVRCLFQDSFKNIWIGIWGGEINFLSNDRTLFHTFGGSRSYREEGRLKMKSVFSLTKDAKGIIWVGTDGEGICTFREGMLDTNNCYYNGNSIQTILCDTYENVWFGVYNGGILRYDHTQGSFRQLFDQSHKSEDVRTMYNDGKGTVWVGTSNGIYWMDEKSGAIEGHLETPDKLVRTILKDHNERIWVGTFGGGLFVYSSQLQLLHSFDTYMGFPSNTVNHIYEDKQGNIWIATGEGLVYFAADDQWVPKVYRKSEGLNNTYIRAVTEDAQGNIWFSTNKGISCLAHQKQTVYNYGPNDNIPQTNFNSGCVFNDNNKHIYFGSLDGVCYFNPDDILKKREAPQVVITGISIFEPITAEGEKETTLNVENEEKIDLKYNQNNLSIFFNIQDYSLNNLVEYAYMLEGMENSWYTITTPGVVTFRNIPPGNYRFLIKSRIRNQEWSDQISRIQITINPPLWLTWWAKLLYLLAGLGILTILLWAYRRKLILEYLYKSEKKSHEQEQELNNERLRFFTNITHELRTPLTLILGPLEDMVKSNSLLPKDRQRISVIHQSAVRLLNLINQILEFRKTETQNRKLCVSRANIAAVVDEIGLKYKELNRNPLVTIRIETEQDNMELYFDREIITMILDNLISNALKYTEKGQIRICARWIEEKHIRYAELQVKDTGYGIKPDALRHIFERYYQEKSEHQASGTGIGLALVKNLVALHESEIRVESEVNIGTSFRILLKAEETYPNALHEEPEKPLEKTNVLQPKDGETSTEAIRNIILIVEDNQDIREYITEALSEQYEIKTAANGKEGLQIALECVPDIVVSDIMMPVMTGMTLCKKLKEDMRTSHIPVILLTAKDSLTDKEEGYQSGADSYLTKPFSASLLQSRIENLLMQRKMLAQRFSNKPDLKEMNRKNIEEKRVIMTESMNKLDKEFLDKVTGVITEHLSSAETIDITLLSDAMCISSSTLYRKVKALTGMSTNEYIRKVKMQLAEKLLLEGKYNISEIAFKVGINSTMYFRQCFKEEFGVSPSEYLKQIKE